MNNPSCRKTLGFTLIELLIVVAIIAILAAIAVPNFLEAQTRAKISRVASDMRTLATGAEAYRVDSNRYPLGYWSNRSLGIPNRDIYTCGLEVLTSPVSYLTTLQQDVFKLNNFKNQAGAKVVWPFYGYYYDSTSPITTQPGTAQARSAMHYLHGKSIGWYMYSIGPSGAFTPTVMSVIAGNQSPTDPSIYDPTNGTLSSGIIVRVAGASNAGGVASSTPLPPAPAQW